MELLPTDQIVITMPSGYRFADEYETEAHLNIEPIRNAVWISHELENYPGEFDHALAVPA